MPDNSILAFGMYGSEEELVGRGGEGDIAFS